MENKTMPIKKRKWWFRALKKIMKIRYKRPTFIYLGEDFKYGSMILSNHEGTDAPMSLEIYCNTPTRMWGAYEMNSGLIKMYKYQTKVYYHEKKHWNLFLARLFCLIASPLTNLFYKGLNLISTYKDARFIKTIRESYDALEKGECIVIYPEDSAKGYLTELEGFYAGFVTCAESCLKKGLDIPIYVTYFRKSDKLYIIDSPVMYSNLKEQHENKEEIAKALVERCNELGKMEIQENLLNEAKENKTFKVFLNKESIKDDKENIENTNEESLRIEKQEEVLKETINNETFETKNTDEDKKDAN